MKLGGNKLKYKLVAIDMDGTLLNSRNQVSKKTIEVLNQVRNKGVETVIATGRLLKSASYYANLLGFSNSIITSNGALMVDEKGKILYEDILGPREIEKIVELSKKHDVYHHFYSEDRFYAQHISREVMSFYDEGDSEMNIDIELYENLSDILENKNIRIHKCLYVENHEKDKLKRLDYELKAIKNLNITSSWHNNIEVMNKGVSKARALEELCRMKGIKPEEVIAIGDNANDIPMLEYAGYSIAMGNALDLVKEVADYTTLTNDEDGLALALERIIL